MRIINITEHDKSSRFFFNTTLEAAGIHEHFVEDISAVQLETALKSGPVALVAVEAHRSFDLTQRTIQQVRALAENIPIFVIFHSEVPEEASINRAGLAAYLTFNKTSERPSDNFLRDVTVIDADAEDAVLDAPIKLLRSLNIEPQFTISGTEISNIRVGSIFFNVSERKAYKVNDNQEIDDEFDGQNHWTSIHHARHKSEFAKRSVTTPRNDLPHQTILFELTAEEAKFLEILASRQGTSISSKDIAEQIYDGIFVPRHAALACIQSSLIKKLSRHVDDPEKYIVYDAKTDSYMLNEQDFDFDFDGAEEPDDWDSSP